MDARQRKTRMKLAATILELSAARRVSDISVSEIAIKAQINRSTFYQHANTPGELLESVLTEELEALRTKFLLGTPPEQAAAAVTQLTRAVAMHIEEHSAVYEIGLSDDAGGASLQPMLNRQFTSSIVRLFEQHTVDIPNDETLSDAAHAIFIHSAARFVAGGAVGAICAWLDTPAPRDVDVFVEVYRRLIPAWWPFTNGTDPDSTPL